MRRSILLYTFALLLTACGTSYHAPTAYQLHGQRGALQPGADYIVRPGDTLFGISWRYGLDMQELARWNGISDPNRILAGSRLHTRPPQGIQREQVYVPQVTSAGLPGWIWPTRGRVTREFSPSTPGGQGIKIAGERGQPIYAARDGEVAYVGSGLSGFGRMIILRHDDKVLSAYGYLADVQVGEKQQVRRGQQIATMGISPQNSAALHFETRKQGQPINPYSFIGTAPRY
ncbi:MAG: peptidoglycan DD-metalloendopeptidase family protein [Cardiobacteriaceae bacterium]|nr:peptidoglycan DD-metalloendopeptidase family protein [Cardiobacteriaceae bacterium]